MGVLLDYPLQLWAEQQEYFDGLLREFRLLLMSAEQNPGESSAPKELIELADMVTRDFGDSIVAINAERAAAHAAGRDRMDSSFPLLDALPALLDRIGRVLTASDRFCDEARMLITARPPHLVQWWEWLHEEMVRQCSGQPPRRWPGPF